MSRSSLLCLTATLHGCAATADSAPDPESPEPHGPEEGETDTGSPSRSDGATGCTVDVLWDAPPVGLALALVESYNRDGNLLRTTRDGGNYEAADGTPEQIDEYAYDSDAKLQLHEVDYAADGIVDARDLWRYDPVGRISAIDEDDNADGAVDATSSYTYDDRGNLAQVAFIGPYGSELTTYTYDAGDRLVEIAYDSGSDGVNDRWELAYDENDQLTSESLDYGADGVFERMWVHTFDTAGHRLTTGLLDPLGVVVQIAWTYEGDLAVLAEEDGYLESGYYTVREPPDGIADRRAIYSYDAEDRLVEVAFDGDADGAADDVRTLAFDDSDGSGDCLFARGDSESRTGFLTLE